MASSIDLDFVRAAIRWKTEDIKDAPIDQVIQLHADINRLMKLLEPEEERGQESCKMNQHWLNTMLITGKENEPTNPNQHERIPAIGIR